MVKDACLRHFGQGGANAGDGLTATQFQAACADLASKKEFGNFKELAENKGLAGAVYSRYRGVFFVLHMLGVAEKLSLRKARTCRGHSFFVIAMTLSSEACACTHQIWVQVL